MFVCVTCVCMCAAGYPVHTSVLFNLPQHFSSLVSAGNDSGDVVTTILEGKISDLRSASAVFNFLKGHKH